jgi:hypothetical protein
MWSPFVVGVVCGERGRVVAGGVYGTLLGPEATGARILFSLVGRLRPGGVCVVAGVVWFVPASLFGPLFLWGWWGCVGLLFGNYIVDASICIAYGMIPWCAAVWWCVGGCCCAWC